jgi:hypothetical protein
MASLSTNNEFLPLSSSSSSTETKGGPEDEAQARMQTVALEVSIVTTDYEVRGVVHVPRGARPDRRLTELLNNPDKRFIAVTDVELLARGSTPTTAQHYDFIELHVGSIQLMHPSVQSLVRQQKVAPWQHNKLDQFRNRLILES